MNKKQCGIYCIKNNINGKLYIGQSIDILFEWKYLHKNRLNKNKHHNPHLQRAWNKYGEDSFSHEIIKLCSVHELDNFEEYYIKELSSYTPEKGYNISHGRNPMRGRKHSENTKKIISEKSIGSKNHFFGKTHSEETIKKMVENRKWYKHSEDTKRRIKENHPDVSGKNGQNFGKKSKNASSLYYGVCKIVSNGYTYWRASIKVSRKLFHIGQYKEEIIAAKEYNNYIIKNNLPNPLNVFLQEAQ